MFSMKPSTWLFSKEYSLYLNEPKSKTLDNVYAPRKYNGKVISDFDDYENDVIDEYRESTTDGN